MTAEQVKEQIGVEEFAEWAVFINSPFSLRNREAMLNAWLVHVIRSMMAPKNKKPKFDQSAFPFHKMAEAFFSKSELDDRRNAKSSRGTNGLNVNKGVRGVKGVLTTKGEVGHSSWEWSKRYEKALADYNAGRTPNSFGLYKGETVRREDKPTMPKRAKKPTGVRMCSPAI